jgi:hypothetical protein
VSASAAWDRQLHKLHSIDKTTRGYHTVFLNYLAAAVTFTLIITARGRFENNLWASHETNYPPVFLPTITGAPKKSCTEGFETSFKIERIGFSELFYF